jgi:hypothetical protein
MARVMRAIARANNSPLSEFVRFEMDRSVEIFVGEREKGRTHMDYYVWETSRTRR